MSRKFLACFASGLLTAAPFVFPALFPLAWISFIPLFWAVERTRELRRLFLLGWLTGAVANLLGFYWLNTTIRVFGGFSSGLSGLIFLLFIALEALPMGLLSVLVRLCGAGPLYFFPALFWVAIEFWFPRLFPWHLGNSQSEFLLLIQSADVVGPYGTSFLLVWLNATLYQASSPAPGRVWASLRPAALLGVGIAVALFYGYLRLSTIGSQMRAAPKLALAAIQGNIDIGQKWNLDQLKENLRSYQDLTRKAQGVDLVIWPETAVEVWLPEGSRQLAPEILPPLQPGTAFFIFGVRSFRGDPARPDVMLFNSAFLADATGRILGRYHKQVLLAFGEYIPFSEPLSLGPGFSAGDGPRTLDLPAGVRVAPLICYEDLMPALSRAFVAEKKADLLVNLTNDAWYGQSAAPWQHARLAQWRAIETRRTLVRVTNTGLTTVINARGEMLETLPIFTPGILAATVEIMEGETLYVRYGDWFAWSATWLALAILLWRWKARRGGSDPAAFARTPLDLL